MGQKQGKISGKKYKKKSGLKHGKEPKQKHKKASGQKGKSPREISAHVEHPLQQLEESFVTNKEDFGEVKKHTYTDTVEESQAEANASGKEDQRNKGSPVQLLTEYNSDEIDDRAYRTDQVTTYSYGESGQAIAISEDLEDDLYKVYPEMSHGQLEPYGVYQHSYQRPEAVLKQGLSFGQALQEYKYEVSSRKSIEKWPEQEAHKPHGKELEEISTEIISKLMGQTEEKWSEQTQNADRVDARDTSECKAKNLSNQVEDKSLESQPVKTYHEVDKQSNGQIYKETDIQKFRETVKQEVPGVSPAQLSNQKNNMLIGHRYQKTARHKHWRTSAQKHRNVLTKKKGIIFLLCFISSNNINLVVMFIRSFFLLSRFSFTCVLDIMKISFFSFFFFLFFFSRFSFHLSF